MAKGKYFWFEDRLDKLKTLLGEGKSAEEIGRYFGLSKEAILMAISRHKIKDRKIEPEHKPRKINEKDLAYRLMVLQGLEVKKPEEIKPFTDEELLSWKDDIDKFCKDLLIWQGKPLCLLDYQKEMIKLWEDNRYSIICSGHQTGKDMCVSAYAIWKSITVPNHFTIIVSPAMRQSQELFSRIQRFLVNDPLYFSVARPLMEEVTFSNNSRILSLPSKGSITGLTAVHLAILNESGRPELPTNIIDDMMPMTMAVEGRLVLLGNPYSKATKFYEYWTNPMFARMHIRTTQNITIPNLNKFLEMEKRRCTTAEYLQRYEGLFADLQNAFIPSRYIDSSCEDFDYMMQRNPELIYQIGVDWGRKADESVLIVVSKATDGSIKVEFCESWYNEPLQKCMNKIEYLDSIFKFNSIIPEYAGLSIPIVDELNKKFGVRCKPFVPTNESKYEVFTHLLKQFEDGMITLPMSEIKLITQLRYLEIKETSTGRYRIGHPEGEHDDYAIALALALHEEKTFEWQPPSEEFMKKWEEFLNS